MRILLNLTKQKSSPNKESQVIKIFMISKPIINLEVPDFIKQNERLHAAYLEKWEEFVRHSIDFSEVTVIPIRIYNIFIEYFHSRQQRKLRIKT